MPHVNIKHFPASLSSAQASELIAGITNVVTSAFGCPARVVSIALEPVEEKDWDARVYVPEMVERRDLVCKLPVY